MHQFNPIEMKKTPKELVGGQGKSLIEKGFKDHQLTGVGGGERLPISEASPDERLLRKHPVGDHLADILFRHCGLHPHLLGMRDCNHCGGESEIWARGEFPRKQKALIKWWLKNEEQRWQIWGGAMEIAAA